MDFKSAEYLFSLFIFSANPLKKSLFIVSPLNQKEEVEYISP